MYENYRIDYSYTSLWDEYISNYHYCNTKEEVEEFIDRLQGERKLEYLSITHTKQLI